MDSNNGKSQPTSPYMRKSSFSSEPTQKLIVEPVECKTMPVEISQPTSTASQAIPISSSSSTPILRRQIDSADMAVGQPPVHFSSPQTDSLLDISIPPSEPFHQQQQQQSTTVKNVFLASSSDFHSRIGSLDSQSIVNMAGSMEKPSNLPEHGLPVLDDDECGVLESPGAIISEDAIRETMEKQFSLDSNIKGKEKAAQEEEDASPIGPGRIRKYANEDPDSPEWKLHDRHFFILSSAGKPIYSRYGDESKLSGLMGAIQAIISVYIDLDDSLRCINAGQLKMVFLTRGPLYFVLISKGTEPESALRDELLWLYHQIVSIITTTQIQRIFEKHGNFDLRRLLGGTEPFLDHLCETVGNRPGYILGAIHSLRMDNSVRQAVGSALQQAKSYSKHGLLYAMLIVKESLITLLRPKKHSFHPSDLHLIFNMVNSSTSFKSVPESWMPICLPKFNDKGFLHAYVCYITQNYPAPASDLCLVLINNDRDSFFKMSECKKLIVDHMTSSGALFLLQEAIRNAAYKVSDVGIASIKHFLFKSKTNIQYTQPELVDSPYADNADETKRLFKLYQKIKSKLHHRTRPLKICYYVTEGETVFAWATASFEVYVTFPSNISKNNATFAVNSLLKWMKKEEDSLFIVNAPTF